MACQMTNLVRLQCCQCGSIADINLAFSDANSAMAMYMAKHQWCEEVKDVGVDTGAESGSGGEAESGARSEEGAEDA